MDRQGAARSCSIYALKTKEHEGLDVHCLLGALMLGRGPVELRVIWFAEDLEFRGMNWVSYPLPRLLAFGVHKVDKRGT